MEEHTPSLAKDDGSFLKPGEKADLKYVVLKETAVDRSESPRVTDSDREVTAVTVDGMALVHRHQRIVSTATFENLTDNIIDKLVTQMRVHKAARCDIVFDRYLVISL